MNFKRIVSGEQFELLCRDVLAGAGATIVSGPSRGPDQRKDLIIRIDSKDPLGISDKSITYLVQCKHKAKSERAVYQNELGDIRNACVNHETDGYFLITSTVPSVAVVTDLEAIQKQGQYETCYWDHKQLEAQIEQLENSRKIVERYNLKEPLDNYFSFMSQVLRAEGALPYQFDREEREEGSRGMIFTHVELDQGKEKSTSTGYFCTEERVDVEFREGLKQRYGLADVFVLRAGGDQTDESLSVDEFYQHIQSYKDTWYQSAIGHIARFSPANPTLIRLVNIGIQRLPYPVQPVTVDLLRKLITAEQLDVLVSIEACAAAAQLDLAVLKEDIFALLERIPRLRIRHDSPEHDRMLALLTERIVSSFTKLEIDKTAYRSRMTRLFHSTSDLQFKADLLYYFTTLDLDDLDQELERLRQTHGKRELVPPGTGIAYQADAVRLWPNMAGWNLEKFIDRHFKGRRRAANAKREDL